MAEAIAALGLVSSIIAVLDLATTVGKQVYKYGNAVKNAKEDINLIVGNLNELVEVLSKLKCIAEQAEKGGKSLKNWPTLASLIQVDGPLTKCKADIGDLQAQLLPVDGWVKQKLERGLWPKKRKQVQKTIKRIEKRKDKFMRYLSIDQIGQSLESGHLIAQLSEAQLEDRKNEIVKWLSHVDPRFDHEAARKKHEDQTGRWFIECRVYSEWKEKGSFVWLKGGPGCGKTILCSEIIEATTEYSSTLSECYVAYYYFSFREAAKQDTGNFLRSILYQLIQNLGSKRLPHVIYDLYKHYQHTRAPKDEMLDAMRSLVVESKDTFIICDALDECPTVEDEQEELCNALKTMSNWALSNLHMLVTSRETPALVAALSPTVDASVSIQSSAVSADVRRFVKGRLAADNKLNQFPENVKHEIENTLIAKSGGMFRWVFCQLDSLKKCHTSKEVQDALGSLPESLDETYARILLSITEKDRLKVARALKWIAYSKQPLRVDEVAEAMVIDMKADPSFHFEHRMFNVNLTFDLLGPLIIREKSFVGRDIRYHEKADRNRNDEFYEIRLAHFSVKEYLESVRILGTNTDMFFMSEHEATHEIIETSLLYIKFYASSSKKLLSTHDFTQFPLLKYVSVFWPEHLRSMAGRERPELDEMVAKFMLSVTTLSSWLHTVGYYFYTDDQMRQAKPFSNPDYKVAPPLHNASSLGFPKIVQKMIDAGVDINLTSHKYKTALYVASVEGYADVVKLLLTAGADLDAKLDGNNTILQVVSKKGHADVMSLLLAAGADPNIQGGFYGTALQAACYESRTDISKLLLEAGANVDLEGGYYSTALIAASLQTNASCIKLLASSGVKGCLDVVNGHCGTALQTAAGNVTAGATMIEILLKAGAAIDKKGIEYSTPLHAAVLRENLDAIIVLIQAGASLDIIHDEYGTALDIAISRRNHTIIKILLQAGAHQTATIANKSSPHAMLLHQMALEQALLKLQIQSEPSSMEDEQPQ